MNTLLTTLEKLKHSTKRAILLSFSVPLWVFITIFIVIPMHTITHRRIKQTPNSNICCTRGKSNNVTDSCFHRMHSQLFVHYIHKLLHNLLVIFPNYRKSSSFLLNDNGNTEGEKGIF